MHIPSNYQMSRQHEIAYTVLICSKSPCCANAVVGRGVSRHTSQFGTFDVRRLFTFSLHPVSPKLIERVY